MDVCELSSQSKSRVTWCLSLIMNDEVEWWEKQASKQANKKTMTTNIRQAGRKHEEKENIF